MKNDKIITHEVINFLILTALNGVDALDWAINKIYKHWTTKNNSINKHDKGVNFFFKR
ncbi:MAG: hypothetical protein ACRCW3_03645 [Metamycoplasmataceae bacterium]